MTSIDSLKTEKEEIKECWIYLLLITC